MLTTAGSTVGDMCGIAGYASSDGRRRPSSWLSAMGAAMVHRGPDDAGERCFDTAGLAFRRLALLDVEGGAQPASDEAGRFWTVFNGEIYNHAELRAELVARGHVVTGTGDAALVPHLFEQWGAGLVDHLRGMFAIAVHDRQTGELFLARDAFGIKPLYWTEYEGAVLFASEIGVLRAVGAVPNVTAPAALSHFLSFGYVPDPHTMWPGVRMLAAGHTLTVRGGRVREDRWWRPELAPDNGAAAGLVDEVLARISGSVTAHLIADVPVGAYLSGGVDSSLLVALAARRQPLSTFSIGFEGTQDGLSELAAARSFATALGTDHHEQVLSAQEYWRLLPSIIAAQEEPLGDPSAPALWFLARQASAHVKAVLSGEGADELFGGYPIYREPGQLRPVTGLPAPLRAGLARVGGLLREGRRGKGYLTRATTPLERRFLGNVPVFSDDAKAALMEPGALAGLDPSSGLVAPYYADTGHLDDAARMQTVSCLTWLPSSILMKADKMAMAHSLEVRVPYLDREVYDVARRLPLSLRIDGSVTKAALRAAAAQVLPAEIARRPKLGFPVPFRNWLDGEMGGQVRELFGSCDDPLLSQAGLLRLLADRQRPDRQRRVWTVMVYLLWRQAQTGAGGPSAQPARRFQDPAGGPDRTMAV